MTHRLFELLWKNGPTSNQTVEGIKKVYNVGKKAVKFYTETFVPPKEALYNLVGAKVASDFVTQKTDVVARYNPQNRYLMNGVQGTGIRLAAGVFNPRRQFVPRRYKRQKFQARQGYPRVRYSRIYSSQPYNYARYKYRGRGRQKFRRYRFLKNKRRRYY